jgi:hypothetical protein
LSELFLWLSPALGDLLDSTSLSNALHTIVLQFLDSGGNPMPAVKSLPLTIMVNNLPCTAVLSPPVLNVSPPVTADACGLLHYGTTTSTTVSLAYTASQPSNYATFSFSLVRGVTPVTLVPPLPSYAPVTSAASPITATVSALLGTCSIGGFAAEVYVYASMTNGLNRQSQYDAAALMGFVLSP